MQNFSQCCKEGNTIAKSAILSPSQTPTVGNAVSETLIVEVNKMTRKVDGLVKSMSQSSITINDSSQQQPQKPATAMTCRCSQNCTKNLVSSSDSKAFINSLCPGELAKVSELKQPTFEFRVSVKTKATANLIAENSNRVKLRVEASMKLPLFIGVVKGVS